MSMRHAVSLAGRPEELIGKSSRYEVSACADRDVLSDVLRTIRLSGLVQYYFMSSGDWCVDNAPIRAWVPNAIPFHIVVDGPCWVKVDGRQVALAAGDIISFPHDSRHVTGAGTGSQLLDPRADLPPGPWRELLLLKYGDGERRVRLLCGYLSCDTINFRPFKDALPTFMHVRCNGVGNSRWLAATIEQIAMEAERPRTGSLSMLERLTEISFIELLRHHIGATRPEAVGWLAALADPSLRKCLALIHDDPKYDWSVQELAEAAGLSRSVLTQRFERMLGTSPKRYVREWRLSLAGAALSTTGKPIAVIAHEAGYGTEAAFNRAFSRAYDVPPATWRQNARHDPARKRKAEGALPSA